MTDYRLFSGVNGPGPSASDNKATNTGLEFYVTSQCWVKEIHVWQPGSGTRNFADRTVSIWRVNSATTGTLLYSGTLPMPATSQWYTHTLTNPVELTPNQRYKVVVNHPGGQYAVTAAYFTTGSGSAGQVSGPLVAPAAAQATGGGQGTYTYNASLMFPTSTFNGGNYWNDLTVTDVNPIGSLTLDQLQENDETFAISSSVEAGNVAPPAGAPPLLATYNSTGVGAVTSHTITLSTPATPWRDVFLYAHSGAQVAPPSPDWIKETEFLSSAHSVVYRLPGHLNSGGLSQITFTTNAARTVAAVVWEDLIEGMNLNFNGISGSTPAAQWSTGTRSAPTSEITIGLWGTGTSSNSTVTFDVNSYSFGGQASGPNAIEEIGDSGSTPVLGSSEGARAWVAYAKNASVIDGGFVANTSLPSALSGNTRHASGILSYTRRVASTDNLGLPNETDEALPLIGSVPTMADENAKAGNATGWEIVGAGDLDNVGFARGFSANAGETIQFSCHGSGSVIDIYRVGYYGGAGWRKVTTISNAPTTQPAPVVIPNSNNGTSCKNWSVTASWDIPYEAKSGLYVGVYRNAAADNASWIPFVVRNDSLSADVIVKTSDSTWTAYNYYGGPSNKEGGANLYGVGSTFNNAARSFAVSHDKPIVHRGARSQTYWMNAEAPLIRFLERNGLNVKYISSKDLDQNPGILNNAKIFISSGHDEYWSANMRNAVEAFRDAGGHSVFMSGNEVFWKTRFDASDPNLMWCYKDTLAGPGAHVAGDPLDPISWTGTWRDTRWAQRKPENLLTNTLFRMNGINQFNATISAVEFQNHPFWRNSSVASGSNQTLQNVIGFEADEMLPAVQPQAVLARTTITLNNMRADDNGQDYSGTGPMAWGVVATRYPSGAVTVGFGTVQWAWMLDSVHDRTAVPINAACQQATINLLADLGAMPSSLMGGLILPTPVKMEAYGLKFELAPDSIGPTTTVGAPVVRGAAVEIPATGISSTVAFGTPPDIKAINLPLEPASITSTIGFGTITTQPGKITSTPASINPTTSVGLPVLWRPGGGATIELAGGGQVEIVGFWTGSKVIPLEVIRPN